LTPIRLRGLPFAATSWEFLVVPAALFLAAIFGKSNESEVKKLYEKLASDIAESTSFQANAAAMHNALRALVVHPGNRFYVAIQSVISWLATQQTARGDWGPMIPFYQAFNGLGHLNIPKANAQFDKALPHIIDSQNSDGSWGSSEKEWKTFLVVHGLRNKGIL
jgi:hypothetical protein